MGYHTLIIQPVTEMMIKVTTFIPTFLTALVILIIGCIVAQLLQKMIGEVLKAIKCDTLSERIGLTRILDKGGVNITFPQVDVHMKTK